MISLNKQRKNVCLAPNAIVKTVKIPGFHLTATQSPPPQVYPSVQTVIQ